MTGIGFFKSNNLYDKVRSDYPHKVSEYIAYSFSHKKQELTVVEVGAGSGKFTNTIINAGLPIKELYIVEPDSDGIIKHKAKLNGKTNYPIFYLNTTSDKIDLKDKTADIIFCGHSFHWFDFESTKKEFSRILNDSGQVFILGRFLDEEDKVSSKYINITRFGKRKEGFTNNIQAYTDDRMNEFYGHNVEKEIICQETIPYSFIKMLGKVRVRINSSGYNRLRKIFLFVSLFFKLHFLFIRYKTKKYLELKYTTFVFCSNMSKS